MTPEFVQNHVMYLAFLHQRGANGEYRRDSFKDSLETWLVCRDSTYELYEKTKLKQEVHPLDLTISEKFTWQLVAEILKAEINNLDKLFEKELKELNDNRVIKNKKKL